jgi:hypothetical protein
VVILSHGAELTLGIQQNGTLKVYFKNVGAFKEASKE